MDHVVESIQRQAGSSICRMSEGNAERNNALRLIAYKLMTKTNVQSYAQQMPETSCDFDRGAEAGSDPPAGRQRSQAEI